MAEISKDRILDAVADCYVRYGPERTTINDVAALAGCSRPTVYKHVGDRNNIAAALLEREWERMRRVVTGEMALYEGAVAKLIEAVASAVGYARSHPLFQRLLACEPQVVLPGLTTDAEPVLWAAIALLGPVVDAGRASGELPAGVEPAMVAEWTARLALSLMITPSITVNADDPDALRRFIGQLFGFGLGRLHRDGKASSRGVKR
jgi:AcrR family transcriptional regulator